MKSMEPIESILQEILRDYRPNQEWFAKELGVSPSTVSRWVKGYSKPRPVVEGRLREIHAKLKINPQDTKEPAVTWIPVANEAAIRNAVDATLRDLREILHRRGVNGKLKGRKIGQQKRRRFSSSVPDSRRSHTIHGAPGHPRTFRY